MNQAKFAVIRFENRNGAVSWRVDGSLNGIRFRKNFKTKGEAAAEKGVLELRAMQDKSGIRCATTFLADAELRQAEDAFRRIESSSVIVMSDGVALGRYTPTSRQAGHRL
jgi:hypothetical protein